MYCHVLVLKNQMLPLMSMPTRSTATAPAGAVGGVGLMVTVISRSLSGSDWNKLAQLSSLLYSRANSFDQSILESQRLVEIVKRKLGANDSASISLRVNPQALFDH
jgi:hypothetical protein